MALGAGKVPAARGLAEELLAELDETLESWEPDLAAEVIISCLKCLELSGANSGAGSGPSKDVLLRRLFRLNPEVAMKLWV